MILFDRKWINPDHISCAYVSESEVSGYTVNVQVGPTLLKEQFSKERAANDRLETILKIVDYDRNFTDSRSSKS